MFALLLVLYLFILAILFLSTTFLIVSGSNWGELPHYYIKLLHKIQEKYAPSICVGVLCGRRVKIIQKRHAGRFLDRIQAAYRAHCYKRFGFVEETETHYSDECDYIQILDLQTDMIQAGIEAVIQVKLALKYSKFSSLLSWFFKLLTNFFNCRNFMRAGFPCKNLRPLNVNLRKLR